MNKKIVILILILNSILFAKSSKIEKGGDIVQLLIPSIAYASTFYMEDEKGRDEFYKSFFSTFATTHILKRTVRERRPNKSNNLSFPSGHTSASFQGATFIHKRYGIKYAIPAYIGASFVGYSRVYGDEHYTHDVLAGAIIGSGFSYYFTSAYKIKGMNILPIVYNSNNFSNTMYGVKVQW